MIGLNSGCQHILDSWGAQCGTINCSSGVIAGCISNAHILENKSLTRFKPPEMACRWEDHCHWLMSSHNKASREMQSHLELQSHTFYLTRIIFTILWATIQDLHARFTHNVWMPHSVVQYVKCTCVKSHVFKSTTPWGITITVMNSGKDPGI